MTDRKKALVTGASEGIGRAFALKLAAEGFNITGVARNETNLKKLVDEIGSGKYIKADLATSEGINAIAKELKETHYDLLVNNAGIAFYDSFRDVDTAKIQAVIRVNCEALTVLSQAFLQNARAGDALVNVSSSLAFMPVPAIGLYSATKAFVTSLSEALWRDQKDRGIYVMGLCPGITSTGFHANSGGSPDKRPPQSMAQTPEQVVDCALRALKKRSDPTVISGSSKVMVAMTRFLPRKTIVNMTAKF